MPKEPLAAKNSDVSAGVTIILQALIVQLMATKLLTVEQGQQVFDGALKKATKASPEVEGVVQYIHDALDWDKMYEASARQKKPKPGPK
jgi:hypothetical protein